MLRLWCSLSVVISTVCTISVWVVVSRVSTISVSIAGVCVAVVSIPALWISIRISFSLGNRVYYTGTVGIVSGIVESRIGVRIVAGVSISMRIVVRVGDDLWSFSLLYFCCRFLGGFLYSLWHGVDIGVCSISIVSSQSIAIVISIWVVSGMVVINPWIGFGFRLCSCESKKSENCNEFHGERSAARYELRSPC